MKTWLALSGNYIQSPTRKLAEQIEPIIGELIMVIPCKPLTYEPDYERAIDYTLTDKN